MKERLDLEGFAQALRVSHCSNDGDHACVGTCKITQKGVELECTLCGSDKRPIAPSELLHEVKIAKAVLAAVGLDWNILSDHTKRIVAEVTRRALGR